MLDHRDGGCRFPGCGSRFCSHHARHWADGGETRLDNLVLLCRVHHRAVHEGGFTVEMVGGQPSFRRPDGRPLPDVPAAPALPADPVAALRGRQLAEGLEITPETAMSGWAGERFEPDWVIAALWRPPQDRAAS
jgi:hypothetical protein